MDYRDFHINICIRTWVDFDIDEQGNPIEVTEDFSRLIRDNELSLETLKEYGTEYHYYCRSDIPDLESFDALDLETAKKWIDEIWDKRS